MVLCSTCKTSKSTLNKQHRKRSSSSQGGHQSELEECFFFAPPFSSSSSSSSLSLFSSMKKLCPNLDREDGLDTVLEVPIPEEMMAVGGGGAKSSKLGWTAWMRPHVDRAVGSGRGYELQLMLGVVGAPLVPLPVKANEFGFNGRIKNDPIEASMAKYIIHQYIAACGGDKALDSIRSMYAMGKVRMSATEFSSSKAETNTKKAAAAKGSGGEVGGFVLWQKKPDLWCLELVVSGCKISAGSDGKVAWRQTPWHNSHAARGPPRPLRRSLQGLDPRSTANLFSSAICIGEKTIAGDDCFILRIDAEAPTLRARSSNNVEIIRHTVWGYFSQRTGLLSQLEDSHLLRIKSGNDENIYWETIMESTIEDYRVIDGISIAHAGRTTVSLFRFGEGREGHTRTRMEEAWTVEEVDFNIWGLSMECFLPPGDLKDEREGCDILVKNKRIDIMAIGNAHKIVSSKVVVV